MQTESKTRFTPLPASFGQAAILRRIYEQADISPLAELLIRRAQAGRADPGAALDLATLLLTQGGPLAEEGRVMQRAAARVTPSYSIVHGDGSGPRIVAIMTPGDFMTNTPVDFLLAGSDAVLIQHFVDETTEVLDLPPHDVAFLAVGEGPENAAVLENLARLLPHHPGPVMNAAPDLIANLTRDRVSEMLAGLPGVLCPPTRQVSRAELDTAPSFDAPMLLRPIGSHAGQGLAKVENAEDLRAYLALHPEEAFYLTPFIDYRGADGIYAKARVVLIGGKPFASHLAASSHWMVHYLNAGMEANPARRAREEAWMADFETGLAHRHATALQAVTRAVGLDYFGLDCAELPDGRLLVFELDVAMIVHDMDSETVFPYKKPAMRKLFDAFVAECAAEARRCGPWATDRR